MRCSIVVACAAAIVIAPLALAGEADDAAALLRGTIGHWSGTLTYKDYQSSERVSLPVKRSVSLLQDGRTMETVSIYDDGPSKTVYINGMALLNAKAGTWESASFRDGDEMETGAAKITLPSPAGDPTHWTVVTLETGTDGDSPATIRQTITRSGERLTTLTEFDRLQDPTVSFEFRNEEAVTLEPSPR